MADSPFKTYEVTTVQTVTVATITEENPVRGAASTALAEGVTALLDAAETVQHCWKDDGTTFCGEDVEPLTLASAEEARGIPCCSTCHRRAMRFRAVLQERAEAELDRLHSWAGLMELLDEHWPESIFPTLPDSTERDAGPRIISLIRRVDAAEARIKAVRDVLDAAGDRGPIGLTFDGTPFPAFVSSADIYRALDGDA